MNVSINVPTLTGAGHRYTERQVVMFSPDQNKRLLRFAKRHNLKISQLIREIVVQVLDAEEKK